MVKSEDSWLLGASSCILEVAGDNVSLLRAFSGDSMSTRTFRKAVLCRCLTRTLFIATLASQAPAQTSLTWEMVKDKFESTNPTLRASQLNIDETRASEISAYLRPNPTLTLSTDGTQLSRYQGVWRPFAGTQYSPSVSYLHERQHKRELRLDQAVASTGIARSTYLDQERGLLFTLRSAFVQTLQAKAVLQNAKDNLEYWDRALSLNKLRNQVGDLSEVDLKRLQLLRVQFETDFENATVSLRTAKIQLLMLMNERTPLDRFDVTGTYDFTDEIGAIDDYRRAALEARPDLRVAIQNVDLARISHKLAVANGSTDPTFSTWVTHNPAFNNPFDNNTIGASVSIPLRIFDRNQGEKARTQIDIARNQRLRDANEALVYSDIDSAYGTLIQNLRLLRTYKKEYLNLAADIRDKMSFSFKNGGASLLDYLDAEKSYRDTRLAYLNLIGSYLTAAAQLNMAAGREVLQ